MKIIQTQKKWADTQENKWADTQVCPYITLLYM